MNVMMKPAKFLIAPLLALAVIANASATALPKPVREALQHAHIPLSGVGIEVREVDARRPLISIHARQPMNPASTMKLLTTYAGLDLLGPAYTWKTEAYLDGKLDNGVLKIKLAKKAEAKPKQIKVNVGTPAVAAAAAGAR